MRYGAGRFAEASNLVVSDFEEKMTKRAAGGVGALSQAGRREMGDFRRLLHSPEAGPQSAYTHLLTSFSLRFRDRNNPPEL